MKFLFSIRRQIALMLSAVSLTLIYSMSIAGSVRPNMTGIKTESKIVYTPEDYFRGVIFQKGPIANLIPESLEANRLASLAKVDRTQLEAIAKMESKIMVDIKKLKPEYFFSFKEVMQSGNQILIKNKISEAQDLILQTVVEGSGIRVTNAKVARKQLSEFVMNNLEEIKSLKSDYYSKSISLEEYNKKIEKIINTDQSGILKAMHNKNIENPESFEDGTCIVLGIVFIIAVAAVGYIAGALAGYLYVAAAAAVQLYLAVQVEITVTKEEGLSLSERSLRNDQYINSLAVNLRNVR